MPNEYLIPKSHNNSHRAAHAELISKLNNSHILEVENTFLDVADKNESPTITSPISDTAIQYVSQSVRQPASLPKPVANDKLQPKHKTTYSGRYEDANSFRNDIALGIANALRRQGHDPKYALALAAKACFESSYGKHPIGKYNYGNITTTGNEGLDYVNYHNKKNGKTYKFINFKSFDDYCNYVVKFLFNNKRYNYVFNRFGPDKVYNIIESLAKSGYAEENALQYAKQITNIYNKYFKNIKL